MKRLPTLKLDIISRLNVSRVLHRWPLGKKGRKYSLVVVGNTYFGHEERVRDEMRVGEKMKENEREREERERKAE